jgi:hypothetical protein
MKSRICYGMIMGLLVITNILIAGCVDNTVLTEYQSTEYIASLGELNDSFTLWEGQPYCCQVVYYYRIEPDRAKTIQYVPLDQSRFYWDADPGNARVVMMDKNGGYPRCQYEDIDRCKFTYNENIIYKFHVPNGTVIKPYGSSGKSSENSGDSVRAYAATRMISTGGQRII